MTRKSLFAWLSGGAFLALSLAAHGQTINVGDDTVDAGNTAATTLDYEAGGDVVAFDFRVRFNEAFGTADVSNCGGASAPSNTSVLCSAPEPGLVIVTAETTTFPTPIPSGSLGFIGISVPGDTVPGPYPVEASLNGGAFGNAQGQAVPPTFNNGQILVEGPFLLFDPASAATVNAGAAEVGSPAPGATIDVTEAGTEDVTLESCQISGAHAADFSFDYSGQDEPLPATFDGGEEQTGTISVDCTPSARGNRMATLSCNVEDVTNETSQSPSWPLTCAGLAPNVAVQPPAASVAVVNQPGSSASATYTISNPQDGFTSSADNVEVSIAQTSGPTVTPPTVGVDPDAFASIPPDGTGTFVASCEADAATELGTYTYDVTVTFDDPLGGGSITVAFTCEVAEERPGYTSDPAPGSTLDFGEVRNQDTSDSQTIAVGNEDSIGDGEFAELDVTNAEVTGAGAANFNIVGFAPFTLDPGAPNGSASIVVQCTPQSIGVFVAVLEVTSNDPDTPHTYPLQCEGITSATLQSSPPAPGGTLNLGAAPPGDLLSGSITFSNGGVDELTLNCELTDDAGGVITAVPDPAVFVIGDEGSESIAFQCVPPEIGFFSGTLSCTTNDPDFPDGTSYTISCQGRPLVVPTMNPWGLTIMALMLLLAGGLFGRRMLVARD